MAVEDALVLGEELDVPGRSVEDALHEALGLSRSRSDIAETLKAAARLGGGGEGPEHALLKEYVRTHPAIVGLSAEAALGEPEYGLPSGDRVDVIFPAKRSILAVEVKPALCGNPETVRGLFQCVKYRSVLEAEARFLQSQVKVEVRLVLGGPFPDHLIPLRNSLGIEVVADVLVPADFKPFAGKQ
jgi:hypothetical protein